MKSLLLLILSLTFNLVFGQSLPEGYEVEEQITIDFNDDGHDDLIRYLRSEEEDSLYEADGFLMEVRILQIFKGTDNGFELLMESDSAIGSRHKYGFPLVDRYAGIYWEDGRLVIQEEVGKLSYRWFGNFSFAYDPELDQFTLVEIDFVDFDPLNYEEGDMESRIITPKTAVALERFNFELSMVRGE